ncbi:MAG: ribose-phosphate diphosphokinase [Candidatus Methanomethylophilaceae archaeon]|jgi:ribose-phosphate pyrophosphokinase|nr:ribose-phosphate diphosphokinase [Candidatus Methanomethylophilaceae archaeon]NBK25153.1 ribose-phosphate diphosphokinase [Spirochaetia bacterium]
MIVVGGSSSRDLAKELAQKLGCKYVQAASTRFPDGECYTRIEDGELDDDVIIVQNTYPDENIVEMFLLQDAVDRLGAKSISLVIPYYGYSRQDRIFKPGEPESAKVMAKRLELLCDRVLTIDIHKEDVLRWFNCPAKDVKAARAIADYFQDRDIDLVLAPDIGAAGRAKEVADYMGVPYDHLEKVRLSGTDVRIAPAHVDCQGKNVLIVDDIIATGGTILAATEQLKLQGAKGVSVACTHGVFTKNALERLTGSNIDALLTCNTLENEVSNISVAKIVADALQSGW